MRSTRGGRTDAAIAIAVLLPLWVAAASVRAQAIDPPAAISAFPAGYTGSDIGDWFAVIHEGGPITGSIVTCLRSATRCRVPTSKRSSRICGPSATTRRGREAI